MRMRRKKRLNERLADLKANLIEADRDLMNVNEAVVDKKYFDFSSVFGNDNSISLEIGCGKGAFINALAAKRPDENFIAVELLSNIIVSAAEKGLSEKLDNVKFFHCGADYLPRYIMKESITNIYLNFSPPYPLERNENRRLTKDELVFAYKNFLKNGGSIFLKTDDKAFFEYSYSQFVKFGFLTSDISNNQELYADGIKTEYENKFLLKGLPIYSLIAKK